MSDDLIRRIDAVQACQVGPSDEWSRDTKSGYNQAATDCAMNILRVPTVTVQAHIDREHVAFSLWKAEADRAAPNVGKNRTPEGFASAAEQERDRWLMLADAAIGAIRKGDQP